MYHFYTLLHKKIKKNNNKKKKSKSCESYLKFFWWKIILCKVEALSIKLLKQIDSFMETH